MNNDLKDNFQKDLCIYIELTEGSSSNNLNKRLPHN